MLSADICSVHSCDKHMKINIMDLILLDYIFTLQNWYSYCVQFWLKFKYLYQSQFVVQILILLFT